MVIKPLHELNRDYMDGKPDTGHNLANRLMLPAVIERYHFSQKAHCRDRKKKRGIFAAISDMLFYLAVFLILLAVFTTGVDNGAPRTVLGFSYFTVVSRSMQDEIPKGSFIFVRQTGDLAIGDNITYMRDRNTSVTHKIVDIYDNYRDSGVRGFQTKGVNNFRPDEDIVYEGNIVGKVILVLPGVGSVMSYLSSNIYLVLLLYGLFVIFSFSIRGLLVKTKKRGPLKQRNKLLGLINR